MVNTASEIKRNNHLFPWEKKKKYLFRRVSLTFIRLPLMGWSSDATKKQTPVWPPELLLNICIFLFLFFGFFFIFYIPAWPLWVISWHQCVFFFFFHTYFEINGDLGILIGSRQWDLFTNCNIFALLNRNTKSEQGLVKETNQISGQRKTKRKKKDVIKRWIL